MEYWTGGEGVTLQSLHDEVVKIAQNNPEHVYNAPDGFETCLYTHFPDTEDARPGCIIGQAVWNITGKLVSQDRGMREDIDGTVGNAQWRRLLGADAVDEDGYSTHSDPANQRLQNWLRKVQSIQDEHYEWGTAVQSADAAFPLD